MCTIHLIWFDISLFQNTKIVSGISFYPSNSFCFVFWQSREESLLPYKDRSALGALRETDQRDQHLPHLDTLCLWFLYPAECPHAHRQKLLKSFLAIIQGHLASLISIGNWIFLWHKNCPVHIPWPYPLFLHYTWIPETSDITKSSLKGKTTPRWVVQPKPSFWNVHEIPSFQKCVPQWPLQPALSCKTCWK